MWKYYDQSDFVNNILWAVLGHWVFGLWIQSLVHGCITLDSSSDTFTPSRYLNSLICVTPGVVVSHAYQASPDFWLSQFSKSDRNREFQVWSAFYWFTLFINLITPVFFVVPSTTWSLEEMVAGKGIFVWRNSPDCLFLTFSHSPLHTVTFLMPSSLSWLHPSLRPCDKKIDKICFTKGK